MERVMAWARNAVPSVMEEEREGYVRRCIEDNLTWCFYFALFYCTFNTSVFLTWLIRRNGAPFTRLDAVFAALYVLMSLLLGTYAWVFRALHDRVDAQKSDRAATVSASRMFIWAFYAVTILFTLSSVALNAYLQNSVTLLYILTLFNIALLPSVRTPVSLALTAASNVVLDALFMALFLRSTQLAAFQLGATVILVIACIVSLFIYRNLVSTYTQSRELIKNSHMLEETVEMLAAANKELESISLTDKLTQIKNRRGFDISFESAWLWAVRSKTPIALLLIDIDDFKRFNDTYGHLEGDNCLQKVAARLKASLSRETDFVARYGGEEFMVLLCYVQNSGVRIVADRILENVRAMRLPHERSTAKKYVTVSIGCATIIPDVHSSAEDLIRRADDALYESKRGGKDRYTFDDESALYEDT